MSDGDRLSHDHEAGSLKLRNETLSDNLCHGLGSLRSHKGSTTGERQREANFYVLLGGGRELVIHDLGGYMAGRTFQERNGRCGDLPFLNLAYWLSILPAFLLGAPGSSHIAPPRPWRSLRRGFWGARQEALVMRRLAGRFFCLWRALTRLERRGTAED